MGITQEAVALRPLALMRTIDGGAGLMGPFQVSMELQIPMDVKIYQVGRKKCTFGVLKPHHILVIYHPIKAEEGKNKMWEQVVSCGERGLVPAVLFIYIEWQMEFLS